MVAKIKKNKVDSFKFVHVENDSSIPPVVGPFESLATKLKIVKDIVMRLPQRPSEAYFEPISYVLQSDFDAYLVNRRNKILNLKIWRKLMQVLLT